ncbi:MAG: replication initiation protein [Chlamydiota bacterium]
MTKVVIKHQFCKLFTTLCGVSRIILWILQEKNEGTTKIHPSICPNNRYLIKDQVKKLKNLTFVTCTNPDPKNKKHVLVSEVKVFDHIAYSWGKITYKFSEEAQKLLNTKQYFEIDLEVYRKLRSQKTKLLYELLCQFRCTGNIGQFAANFKKNLGLENKMYKDADSFEKTVLKPVIDEIEKKTAFKIKRDEEGKVAIKIGKFVYFCFSEVIEQATPVETLEYTSLYERLIKKGVPAKVARKARQGLGDKYLRELIYCVELDKSDGKIESKLKVLVAKISKALSLKEPNAEKKRKRIEAKNNPKKLKSDRWQKPKNPSKKIVYKAPPLVEYDKEYTGAESVTDILSGIIPNKP